MTIALRLLAAALFVAPLLAVQPTGFALWKSAELRQRDEALSKKMGKDHSARETLATPGLDQHGPKSDTARQARDRAPAGLRRRFTHGHTRGYQLSLTSSSSAGR